MADGQTKSAPSDTPMMTRVIVVVGVLALVIGGAVVGIWWVSRHILTPGQGTAIAGIVAGAAALAAATVAFLNWRSLERQTAANQDAQTANLQAQRRQLEEQQRHALQQEWFEQESNLHQRFQDAATQLGSASTSIRLAGVYAMATVGDDWIRRRDGELEDSNEVEAARYHGQTQACIDVLCAIQRTPVDQASVGELAIRSAISSVFAVRLRPEAPIRWSGSLTFDFTGAQFYGRHDFDKIQLDDDSTILLNGATFAAGSSFNMRNCRLTSCVLDLGSAHLEGTLDKNGGAIDLHDSVLSGRPRLNFGQVTRDEGSYINVQCDDSEVDWSGGSWINFFGSTGAGTVVGPWPGDLPPGGSTWFPASNDT